MAFIGLCCGLCAWPCWESAHRISPSMCLVLCQGKNTIETTQSQPTIIDPSDRWERWRISDQSTELHSTSQNRASSIASELAELRRACHATSILFLLLFVHSDRPKRFLIPIGPSLLLPTSCRHRGHLPVVSTPIYVEPASQVVTPAPTKPMMPALQEPVHPTPIPSSNCPNGTCPKPSSSDPFFSSAEVKTGGFRCAHCREKRSAKTGPPIGPVKIP